MKSLLMLIFALLLFSSCGDSTRDTIPEGADTSNVSWKGFQKYCGPNNLKNFDNFKKLKGSTVTWTGKVYTVQDDPGMEESRNFEHKVIRVIMPNSESLLSDLTLRMATGLKGYSSLKKGDYVLFRGKIAYIGSKLNDHIIEVTKFKKVKPKKKF
jgi:hypothetical protein